MENANHCRMRAIDGADYAPLCTAVWTDLHDIHQDHVSVHGRADLMWRNKDVTGDLGFKLSAHRFGIGDHEPESVAVHAQTAGDEVLVGSGLRKLVSVGVDWNQSASFDELL